MENVLAFVGGNAAQNQGRMYVDAEAADRAQGQRRPGDRAAASQDFSRAGRDTVFPVGAGPADRRPPVQRAVSVHAVGRKSG